MADREEYSVIVERSAFSDEPSIEVLSSAPAPRRKRASTAHTTARTSRTTPVSTPVTAALPAAPAPAAARTQTNPAVRAQVDAAFQPWIANVTPAPLPVAPKATPIPANPKPLQLSGQRKSRMGTGPFARPESVTDDATIPEVDPTHAHTHLIDGKYKVEAILGHGGMGIVVAASHIHLGTTVAIKTLRPEAAIQPEMARRFLREARAASRLRSDHVCKALDVGQMPSGEPFIVMEMLHGQDLASIVRASGPLSVGNAAAYVLQACDAVSEAHSLGMIHRDLKPANLMLTQRTDGAALVKVLDFGIATAATGDVDGGLTRADVAMGSPGYMSPEQLRSAKSVDARSDIWSLGITLYELVTGRAPFSGDSVSAVSISVATEEPAPMHNVPAAFAAVVARCLRKSPADRYATVAELAAALAPFAHDGAARAARIANVSQQSLVPPTLMGDNLVDARLAVTAAVSLREAPPLAAVTAMPSIPSAPVFLTGERSEATHRLPRVPRRRVGLIAAIAIIGALALGVAGYAKLHSSSDEPGAVAASTAR